MTHDVMVSAAECGECKLQRVLGRKYVPPAEHLQAQKDALAELAVKWYGSVEEAIKDMREGIARVEELLARHRAQMEAKR